MITNLARTAALGAASAPVRGPAPPARPVRLCADVTTADSPLSALRIVLMARLLSSVTRSFAGTPATWVLLDPHEAVPSQLLRMTGVACPVARARTARDATDILDGSPDLIMLPAGSSSARRSTGDVARIGPVAWAHRGVGPAEAIDRLHDPLALRLALLRFAFAAPATLSTARLRRAEETLDRWRFKVSGWHDRPLAPPPPELAAMRSALLDHLDTPRVLTALHRLEVDAGVPSGTKFAAFTALDQVLELALSTFIGRHHL